MMARLLNLIGIGRMTLIDDTGDVQLVQMTEGTAGNGLADRVTERIKRITEYGFASSPPADTDVVVLRRNGDRGLGLAIATSHKASRPKNLPKGDVWIYDLRGHAVKMTAHGIEIDAAGDQVTVTNASRIRAECDIETTGDIISRCDGQSVSLNALRDAYDVHDHPPIAAGASWGSGPPNDQV